MAHLRLRAIRQRLRLREKIAAGYLSVLILAICGILLGYSVGDYFQYQSVRTSEALGQSLNLLTHLEIDLLRTQRYGERLFDQTQTFQTRAFQTGFSQTRSSQTQYAPYQYNADGLQQRQKELEATWLSVQQYTEKLPAANGAQRSAMLPIENFAKGNRPAIDSYIRTLESISTKSIDQTANGDDQLANIHSAQLRANNIDAEKLSESLQGIIQENRRQLKQANAAIESTDILRFQIASGFIIGSASIALFLIAKLSKAIIAPLLSLNQIARTVTHSKNFTLTAPVLTSDEVGDLAISMNELIASVHDLLQRLEQKNQALADQKTSLEKAIKDLQNTQLQLVQVEKMSALGKLVAGIAHEINNPVTFIAGNIEHTNRHLKDLMTLITTYQACYPEPHQEVQNCIEEIDLAFLSADVPKVVQSMRTGTERITDIVLSLRTFSRMDEAECKAVDLHDGLDSTLTILEHRLKSRSKVPTIRVIKKYEKLPFVTCYAGQINQVFMNILTNAIDALEDAQTPNAEIVVSTFHQATEAVVTIEDNGPGIEVAIQSKIFDPFFTTKAVGKGTGMGMATSYQIVVDRHQGQLLCESSPNQGAKFTIRLPLTQQKTDKIALKSAESSCV